MQQDLHDIYDPMGLREFCFLDSKKATLQAHQRALYDQDQANEIYNDAADEIYLSHKRHRIPSRKPSLVKKLRRNLTFSGTKSAIVASPMA